MIAQWISDLKSEFVLMASLRVDFESQRRMFAIFLLLGVAVGIPINLVWLFRVGAVSPLPDFLPVLLNLTFFFYYLGLYHLLRRNKFLPASILLVALLAVIPSATAMARIGPHDIAAGGLCLATLAAALLLGGYAGFSTAILGLIILTGLMTANPLGASVALSPEQDSILRFVVHGSVLAASAALLRHRLKLLDAALSEARLEVKRRERVEIALRQSEAKLRAFLDAFPDPAFIVDEHGRCLDALAPSEGSHHFGIDKLIGRRFQDVFPEDLAASCLKVVRKTLQTQRVQSLEYRIDTPEGARYFEGRTAPTIVSELDPPMVIWVSRDISNRKNTEQALRQEETRYRALFEDAPISLWEEDFSQVREYFLELQSRGIQDLHEYLDTHSNEVYECARRVRILDVNRATLDLLKAASKADLRGDLTSLLDEDSITPFRRELAALADGKHVFEEEILTHNMDGEEVHVSMRLSVAPGFEDTWSKVFVSLTDITQRILAERALERQKAELARSNAELEQFAYVASHDLQEPLRMISSYMQLLERRYRDRLDVEAQEFISFAVDGSMRMQRLISDLLAYSRVGSKGTNLKPTDCDSVLEQVLANMSLSLEESQAILTRDSLPTVMADEVQVGQLFQNLISNAIKFRGPQQPEIHIGAHRQDEQWWVLEVRDNGIGIEAQYLDRIFVIFQRLHGREEYSGTGIGLAICKKIVEQHGGTIWVESEPGGGSTFYFTMLAERSGEGTGKEKFAEQISGPWPA